MSRYFEDSDMCSEEDITLTGVSRRSLSPYLDDDLGVSPLENSPKHRSGRTYTKPRDRHYREPVSRYSFGTTESLSTIPSRKDSEDVYDEPDVREVYAELQDINEKMKQEFKVLSERGILLKEKEKSLEAAETMLQKTIEVEVEKRLAARDKQHKLEMEKLDSILREKTKEHRRLKENFDVLKSANDNLRKELTQVQQQHDKLEKQSSSLQHRLTNLQRKQEYQDRKDTDDLPLDLGKVTRQAGKEHRELVKSHSSKSKACGSIYDVLGVLLEWICDVHLRPTAAVSHLKKAPQNLCPPDLLQDRCFKILPHLVELLRDLPSSSGSKLMLPCLQFTYWSLHLLDQAQQQQQLKASMSSTLRRLGEELYRPRSTRYIEDDPSSSLDHGSSAKDKHGLYFRSDSLHLRFLSSLVILKTITQVDHLAQVYEVLRSDLKAEPGKELFIHYQATPVILSHLKPSNKCLMLSAIDIYLQMSMESATLQSFLDSCSTESWFRTASMAWRMPAVDEKILEKLSIILQKLSKMRSNRKFFEVFAITSSAQEYLRTKGNDNAFLKLNLKSVLFNLNVPKLTNLSHELS